MSTVVVIARVLLAVMFVVAGLTKLRDPAGSRRAMREFGVPGALAAPVAVLLPFAELGIAGGLGVSGSARWAAACSCVLLGVFSLTIALNLARGRRPTCNCFGQLQSRPVSAVTVLRNLALLGLAAVIVVHPSRLGTGALIALAVSAGVALQAWVAVQLLRQNGRILVRLAALEQPAGAAQPSVTIGSPAPNFVLEDTDGATSSLPSLLAHGRPLVLVFVSPGCGPCDALLPLVAVWQQRFTDQLTTAIISAGSLAENKALAAQHRLERLLIQDHAEVAADYRVTATPSVVLIDEQGRLASEIAAGQDSALELVAGVVGFAGRWERAAVSSELQQTPEPAPPGSARVAATLGAATLLAGIGPSATARAADAERQAISALLARADPQIEAHARTISAASARFSHTLAEKPAVRSAVLQAVARQRQDFTDLRQAVSTAAASTPQASYAKQLVIDTLGLLDGAFKKIEDSLHTRNPRVAVRAVRDSRALFDQALQRGVDAGAALQAP